MKRVLLVFVFLSFICTGFAQTTTAPDIETLNEFWLPKVVEKSIDLDSLHGDNSRGFFSKFVNWVKKNPVTALVAIVTGDVTSVTTTYIAEKTVDLTQVVVDEIAENIDDNFPDRFDLRDYHLVSDVDQQYEGTCVPMSIVAALEIEVKKKLMHSLPESEYDINLSESSLYSQLDMEKFSNHTTAGHIYRAAERKIEIPLEQNVNGWNKPTVKIRNYIPILGSVDPLSQYLITQQYFANNLEERKAIKTVIKTRKCGVIISIITKDDDFGKVNLTGKGNIWNENHNALIVGWDNSACDGKGAWIIKNSWGIRAGDEGYQYLEYGARGLGWPFYITDIELNSWNSWINELNTEVTWIDPEHSNDDDIDNVLAENFGNTWCTRELFDFEFSNPGPISWGFSTSGIAALANYAMTTEKAYECADGTLIPRHPELIINDNPDITPAINLLLD